MQAFDGKGKGTIKTQEYIKDEGGGKKTLQKLYYDIWISYIHNFIIIFSWVYNEPIQWPAPSWLVSLIGRALHLYRRAQEYESGTSRNFFFQTFFLQLQKLRI